MFWFATGYECRHHLMAIVTAIGDNDRVEDAYQEGYDIGFYEAMSLKGDRNGKAYKV